MTLVKVCGITNVHDAQVAAALGADFLGFVFYPNSPRFVTHEQARCIIDQLGRDYGRSRPHLVGVFVDEALEHVSRALDFCGLDYAQLHGSETPETVSSLMESGHRAIKAFRIQDSATLGELARYQATAFLLDAYVPDQPGGTGHSFDWTLAARAREQAPIILAGGLTPDNVTRAIRTVMPWGVDVSSGVETAPGQKDPAKVQRFINAARNA